MKKILVLAFVAMLITPLSSFAYRTDTVRWRESLPYKLYNFKKVKKSELKQNDYPISADAPAVILYELQDIFVFSNYGKVKALNTKARHFMSEETTTRRIKILSEEGKKYATVKFQFKSDATSTDTYMGFAGATAYSYTLDGNKKLIAKLDKKSVKLTRVDNQTMQVEFIIPNVSVGSIIEYEYTITGVTLIPNVERSRHLQSDIPILHSTCQIWHDRNIWDVMVKNDKNVTHQHATGGRAIGRSYMGFQGGSERSTSRGVDFTSNGNVLRNNNYMDSYVPSAPITGPRAYCDIEIYDVLHLSKSTPAEDIPTITVKVKDLEM